MKLLFSFVSIILFLFTNAQDHWTPEMVSQATKNHSGIQSYTASDGVTYAIGDTVTFGNATGNGRFVYVSMGDGMFSAVQYAPAGWGGKTAEIKKIRVTGTKRQGRTLWITCKGPMQPFHIDVEKAIETGEVDSAGYTSDEALEELKKAKDKLDLGLISQEEFEELREELSQYID